MQEPLMSDNILPSKSNAAASPENLAPLAAETAWIIETHSLTKRFHHLTAVDGLTLAVSEGQVFGLLGPNGAGKTTLMKMLVTLLPPTSGTAKVAGHDLLGQPALVRRSIGYVPQLLSADGMLTGYENLLIFAQLYDLPRKERTARIDQALTSAGLQDARTAW
jgi:ABC-2 type transport system ATP-binding protein